MRRHARLDLVARNPPDFFGVTLEERPIETPAETIAYPLLESSFFRIGPPLRLKIAANNQDAFQQAQIDQGVEKVERVLEETILVKEA